MEDDNEIKNYWSKLLLFLIIVFLGYLTYYKFMVFDKKVPTDNKVKETEKSNENIIEPGIDNVHYADDDGEDIKIDENNIEETYEKIKYEIKEEYCEECATNLNYLYVNGKKIESANGDIKVNQLKDVLIVEWIGFVSYDRGVVYVSRDGITHKFDYLVNPYSDELPNNRFSEYKILEDGVEFEITRDNGFDNSTGWMCKTDEIAKYIKFYKYLGEGKFDNGTILKEITVKEIYSNPEGCDNS